MAKKQINKPYVWGGRGPSVFDCSGLIVWSYKQVFPDLQFKYGNYIVQDVTMDILWRYNIQVLPLEHIQPGDIIFLTSSETKVTHGGLFIRWLQKGEMEIIHASSALGGVVIEAWRLDELKRGQWFLGAGRLITTY